MSYIMPLGFTDRTTDEGTTSLFTDPENPLNSGRILEHRGAEGRRLFVPAGYSNAARHDLSSGGIEHESLMRDSEVIFGKIG